MFIDSTGLIATTKGKTNPDIKMFECTRKVYSDQPMSAASTKVPGTPEVSKLTAPWGREGVFPERPGYGHRKPLKAGKILPVRIGEQKFCFTADNSDFGRNRKSFLKDNAGTATYSAAKCAWIAAKAGAVAVPAVAGKLLAWKVGTEAIDHLFSETPEAAGAFAMVLPRRLGGHCHKFMRKTQVGTRVMLAADITYKNMSDKFSEIFDEAF